MDVPQMKWEAKVSTLLEQVRPDQVWPLLEDFFGLNKWFPGLPTCHGLQGVNGVPGCIRYCSGFGIKRKGDEEIKWSKERLVSIDRKEMTFTYDMVDSNIGFQSYVSTLKVFRDGTVVWWISLDPVDGWQLPDLVGKYENGLKGMVKNMEAAICNNG
ncbi:Polyketide cyclase/dehydrase and lipid transport superfamily protein [Striga hermonthica]|uniref:Polyketide cyclase/dehydrase and lipid transport superfamily protein n=1 Tax=Striga hermonthica TaxID=68872 RepID=A0A9N7MPI6_STRHE|nr:Polyketide cyclase/dehydrase and lipid transport superfamily protein [Striga hermonthica]